MSIVIALAGADGIVLATDGRLLEYSSFREHMSHDDHSTKLWTLTDYIGIMSATNIAGYDLKIVEMYQEKLGRDNEKSLKCVAEEFTRLLADDLLQTFKVAPQLLFTQNYQIEFVLAGYHTVINREVDKAIPKIVRIYIHPEQLVPSYRIVDSPYYITGVRTIGKYWINKVRSSLSTLNVEALKRLGVMIVSETATASDAVGGDMQVAVIREGKKIHMLELNEIKKIKQDMSKVADGKRLIKLLER